MSAIRGLATRMAIVFAAVLASPATDTARGQAAHAERGIPAETASQTAPRLEAIPEPDLGQVEEGVRLEIIRKRELHDALLAKAGVTTAEQSESFGKLGIEYHRFALLLTALACYRNAETLAPGDYRWPYYQAFIARAEGDTEGWAAALQRSLRLNASHLPTRVYLGDAFAEQSLYENAASHYRAALQIDHGCARAYYGLGQIAAAQQNYKDAEQYFIQVLRLAPTANSVAWPLSQVLLAMGKEEDAKKILAQKGDSGIPFTDQLHDAIRRENTESWRLLQNQAGHLSTSGDLRGAADLFARAVAIAPREERSTPLGNLGATRVKLATEIEARATKLQSEGKLEEAAKEREAALELLRLAGADFEAALEITPRSHNLRFNLGTLLAKRGDDEAAIKNFRLSLEANPEQRDSHFNLGNALRRQKQFAEAAEHFRHVVKLYPGDEQARLALALCQIRLHDYEAARKHLEESRIAVPESYALHVTLLRVLATNPVDPAKDAQRVLEEAEQILTTQEKREANLLVIKAIALTRFERWQEAEKILEQIVGELAKANRTDLIKEFQGYLDGFKRKERPIAPWSDDHPQLEPRPLRAAK